MSKKPHREPFWQRVQRQIVHFSDGRMKASYDDSRKGVVDISDASSGKWLGAYYLDQRDVFVDATRQRHEQVDSIKRVVELLEKPECGS